MGFSDALTIHTLGRKKKPGVINVIGKYSKSKCLPIFHTISH